jgi:hypothetical protein
VAGFHFLPRIPGYGISRHMDLDVRADGEVFGHFTDLVGRMSFHDGHKYWFYQRGCNSIFAWYLGSGIAAHLHPLYGLLVSPRGAASPSRVMVRAVFRGEWTDRVSPLWELAGLSYRFLDLWRYLCVCNRWDQGISSRVEGTGNSSRRFNKRLMLNLLPDPIFSLRGKHDLARPFVSASAARQS